MRTLSACMAGFWLLGAACGGESQSEVSGQIVAMAPEQDALTVETESGTEQQIRIAEDTRILTEDGAPLQVADLAVGSEITVEAADDRSLAGGLRARSIWLQDSAPEGAVPLPPPASREPSSPPAPESSPPPQSEPQRTPESNPQRAPESNPAPGAPSR
jgi:hypothetical protein